MELSSNVNHAWAPVLNFVGPMNELLLLLGQCNTTSSSSID